MLFGRPGHNWIAFEIFNNRGRRRPERWIPDDGRTRRWRRSFWSCLDSSADINNRWSHAEWLSGAVIYSGLLSCTGGFLSRELQRCSATDAPRGPDNASETARTQLDHSTRIRHYSRTGSPVHLFLTSTVQTGCDGITNSERTVNTATYLATCLKQRSQEKWWYNSNFWQLHW